MTTSAGPSPGADSYVPGHGDLSYDVIGYDLELDYGIVTNRLSGRATVDATARESIKSFGLDLHGLRVSKVILNGDAATRYAQRRGKIIVTPSTPLPRGSQFTVAVTYSGAPGTVRGPDGDAGWEELADGVIIASQPHGAPSWFPCNDRPSDKSTYRIAVTTSSDYTVVANGVLSARRRAASGTTWVYEQREPMASYLATIQIGRYVTEIDSSARVPVRLVYPRLRARQVAAAFARQGEMITYFTRVFGPYPFADYAVVVTDDALEIPVESQGISVFGSNFLSQTWDNERLIAHELAHQWFGNSLTAASWRDIWLHEGFACYSEWLWSEASGHGPAADQAATCWRRLSALPKDILVGDPGARRMFDDRVYKRGALTLHALRVSLGDARFFRLLQRWVADHAHGSVTTEQLVALVRDAGGPEAEELLASWLFTLPLPRLPAGPNTH